MKDIIVSIVIPTYNRANDLRRCLFSLVSQTYRNFEVIVCDDGSTDDSEVVIKEFQFSLKINYYHLENFGGPSRPRNFGIQKAKGKYIALLDSDDWWTPKKLEVSVSILESKNIDLVYHDLYKINSTSQFLYWKKKNKSAENAYFTGSNCKWKWN